MGMCSSNNCQQYFGLPQVTIKLSSPQSHSCICKEASKSKESNSTIATIQGLSIGTDFKINRINQYKSGKMTPVIKGNAPIINFLKKRKHSYSPHSRKFRLKQNLENTGRFYYDKAKN